MSSDWSWNWANLFSGLQVLATFFLGVPTLWYLKRYVNYTQKLAQEASRQTEAQVSPALVLEISKGGADQGTVRARNIGEHAALDVQVEPMEALDKTYIYKFDRIPAIEKGRDEVIEAVLALKDPQPIFTITAAYKALEEGSSATISCKSISGKAHVFHFVKAKRARDEKLYYCFAERQVTAARDPLNNTHNQKFQPPSAGN